MAEENLNDLLQQVDRHLQEAERHLQQADRHFSNAVHISATLEHQGAGVATKEYHDD